ARAERRLAAILAADIVGYSRLVEQDEAGTLAAIRELRDQAIGPLLAEHKGRIVKLMGDGAIVEFASVVDAVACAVAIQQAVAERQAESLPERRIVFRIGINLGDVVVDGDDLLGDGVNVAARLEQLCEPGGVLVSGTAFDHLQGRLGLPLEFTGEQQVKNIAWPVRAYRVRLDGGRPRSSGRLRRARPRVVAALACGLALLAVAGGVRWLLGRTDAPVEPSIAVLPFEDLGGDDATGRLADGITEDIITDLARFRDLAVIARNSTAVYRNRPDDVRRIGRDLGARFVLEGSIPRQGGQVRVTAQLIDAGSGAHVWSEQWDRPIEDVFAVQTELADRVAGQLGGYTGTILATDRATAARKRPSDLSAYDLYLLAVERKQRETKESIAEAVALLERSLAIDPDFARAWMVLGSCYAVSLRWSDDWNGTHARYEENMRRAVELDPMDAEARAGLGFALAHDGDMAQAEAEFQEALRLNPNSADVLARYALWQSTFGKPDEGAVMAERAIRLNPAAPPWALRFLRDAFLYAGRNEQALEIHRKVPKEMFSDADYIDGAMILIALGRDTEAKALAAKALAAFPAITIEGWTGDPGWNDADRRRTIELMAKAGFPACASDAEFAKGGIVVLLPECTARVRS
ncbi:MAG: adenylate/guanylate cyclase domain-containing protein, partial [Geminicoccaceae bacterium]